MKVRDKKNRQMVDVSEADCPNKSCYWPRPDPGVFTQGVGYRTRNPGKKPEWLCGNREIHGCPIAGVCKNCRTAYIPGRKVCEWCGKDLAEFGEPRRP